MARFVVSIDQGTTGTTVLVFDEQLELRARGYREFEQHFPQPGWVEHDPEQIWQSVTGALADALHHSGADVDAAQVAAIGITNQRETTLVWERATGKPLHRAIVWQDRRTADICATLKAAWLEDEFKRATGLVLDPYFSGTKLQWLLDNVDGLRARAERGEVCFGTVDSYLVWRLTGGAAHVTDVSNASRTLLFDLHTLRLERAAVRALESAARDAARRARLVGALRRDARRARAARRDPGLRHRRRSAGGAVRAGLLRRRRRQVHVRHRRVHADEHGQTRGAVATTGCSRRSGGSWATRSSTRSRARRSSPAPWCSGCATGSASSRSAREIEALARRCRTRAASSSCRRWPGLGAPHWRPEARGIITGLTRGTTKAHLARAVLEGIALQIADLLGAMQADAGVPVRALKVDGGASANNLLDAVPGGRARLRDRAAGARRDHGARRGAARGHRRRRVEGHRRSGARVEEERRFKPSMAQAHVDEHKRRWKSAVERA